MTDKPNDGSKGFARIVRLGDRRLLKEAAEPIPTVEALALLAGDLARFEDAVKAGAQDPPATQARISGLEAMRLPSSIKSSFSVRREVPEESEMVATTPFSKRQKPKVES